MTKRLYRLKRFNHRAPDIYTRAHLEVYGIDHFRPSYDVLVFFNDPDVTIEMASEERDSYAGRFSVFGHVVCYGSEGHCTVGLDQRRFDIRRSHPLTKAFKRIDVTDALRAAAATDEYIDVTLVAATADDESLKDVEGPLFSCSGMQLVTFL